MRLSLVRARGAESCPGDAELGRRVAARIGRDPFAERASRSVDVRVERRAGAWRAEIRLVGADGELVAARDPLESEANDCAALADAVVLAVALTIDPQAALAPPTPPPPASPPPLPAPPQPCPERVCAAPSCPVCPTPPAVPEPTRVRASLRALGALGVLPGAAAGVGIAGEVEPPSPVSLGVGLVYLPEHATDDGSLAFGLSAVEPFGCVRIAGAQGARLGACAGVQIGSLHAVARSLRPVAPGDYLWLAPTLGPRGLLALGGSLDLELGAVAALPVVAHEFVVRGRPGSAHEPKTIGLFGWLGLGFRGP